MNALTRIFLAVLLCTAGAASAEVDRIALNEALKALHSYEFGGSVASLRAIENAATSAGSDKAVRQDLDVGLRKVIENADATKDAKRFACRQLTLVASGATFEALVPLLRDPELAAHAVRVFEASPDVLAEAILGREIYQFEPPMRDSLLLALGRRGSEAGINFAKDLLAAESAADRKLAADYLSLAGSAATCGLLLENFAAAADPLPLVDGCALCAQKSAADPALQAQVFAALKTLFGTAMPSQSRAAAVLQLAALPVLEDPALEAERTALLAGALEDGDIEVARARAVDLARSQDPGATAALLAPLATAVPDRQVIVLEALRRRGDTAAAGPVAALMASENAAVKIAAIQSLDAVGTTESVAPLLDALSGEDAATARAAGETLARMGSDDVTAAIAAALADAAPERKAKILELLGTRGDAGAKAAVMAYAFDEERLVFEGAQGALAQLGGAEDIAPLLDGAMGVELDRRQRAVFTTIVAIAARQPEDTRNAEILTRLGAAGTPEARAPFIALLGRTGGATALAALLTEAKDGAEPARLAAVEGLGAWTTAEPVKALIDIVKENAEGPLRDAAFAGATALLIAHGGPQEEVADYAAELRKHAKTDEERKQILRIAATVPTLRTFNIAREMSENAALQQEAEQAMIASGRPLVGAYGHVLRARMLPISRTGSTEEIKAAAKEVYDLTMAFGEYLSAWAVSGPYLREGVRATELFDAKFAPEDALLCGEETPRGHKGWEIMPMGQDPAAPGYINLSSHMPGANECVTYLRCCFEISAAQVGRIAVGSNDGFKLWHNGELKVSVNEPRSYKADQDIVMTELKPGEHTIVLAVYQHAGDWGASVKLSDPAESPLVGMNQLPPV